MKKKYFETELHVYWCIIKHICKNVRIFHGCEVRIEKSVPRDQCLASRGLEKSVQGSLFGITRLCRVKPNSDPEGWIFQSAPNNHDRFFFLHTFRSHAFDFNVGVAMNKSCCFTLTYAILKVDVVCDVTMTSTATS